MSNKPVTLDDTNFDSVANGGLPVLVDFHAPWCGPCQTLSPVIDELAAEFDGKAVVAKVNVDEAPGVAGRFGVRSIPTLVILVDGEEKTRIVGLTTKRDLAEKMAG